VGAIVHKLFQFDISSNVNLTRDDLAGIMRDTLASGDLDMPGDPASVTDRALRAWTTMKARADVAAVLAGAERFHEVPFSLVVPGEPPRIVRGSIDCLACAPDGSVTVLEFKTGRPRPEHNAQLDLYVRAAREMFPGAPVQGRLIYAT
jgi:RecB family exonuclease